MSRNVRLLSVLSLLPLFIAAPACLGSDDGSSAFDAAQYGSEVGGLNEFIRQGRISGFVTAVQHDSDEPVWATGGQADMAAGRPMQQDTIFRVASLSKTLTATALLQLIAAGRCGIDDPVAMHLPAFRQPKLADGSPAREPTIREILTHTAGLANSSGLEGDRTLEQEVDAIARRPLQFPPGSRWQYSSGLTVAGRLIEVLSGKSFEDYLSSSITEPLGMRDTAFSLSPPQALRLAVTYQPGDAPGSLRPVSIPDPTVHRMPNPSGGLYSTTGDLLKFYRAVLDAFHGRPTPLNLSQETVREMLTPHTGQLETGFTPGNAWGLGWCLIQRPQGVTRLLSPETFGHGGAWGTQAWVDPHRNLILLLMIQRSGFGNSDGSEVRDAFNEAVLRSFRGTSHDTAKITAWHGHQRAVELTRGNTRVVLGPETGGRVLEYTIDGRNALYLDERESAWQPGMPPQSSAGRFDFGPELVVPRHTVIWSGPWTAEITGAYSARLVSQRDPESGVQLIRDFSLVEEAVANAGNTTGEGRRWAGAVLVCRQVLMNTGSSVVEYCHWGRSFHPQPGICVIPLGDRPSRFPSKYVMYEADGGINPKAADPQIRERDGVLEILGPPRRPKLGFDTYAGWLAFVMPDNRLFVKRFPADPDRVYNEAAGLTISVWYPQGKMVELEPIGPRERLVPGAVAEFTETWSVAEFSFPAAGEFPDLARIRQLVVPAAAEPGAGASAVSVGGR
ncbi:MAG: Esterase EstB [Planctomycetota bacterium]|jgi:CubicO group peptidase (beta-lactamase class C family)